MTPAFDCIVAASRNAPERSYPDYTRLGVSISGSFAVRLVHEDSGNRYHGSLLNLRRLCENVVTLDALCEVPGLSVPIPTTLREMEQGSF